MSIKLKITLGFGFALVAMLVITVASISSANKLEQNTKWVSHTHEVLLVLEQFMSHLKDTEPGSGAFWSPLKKTI